MKDVTFRVSQLQYAHFTKSFESHFGCKRFQCGMEAPHAYVRCDCLQLLSNAVEVEVVFSNSVDRTRRTSKKHALFSLPLFKTSSLEAIANGKVYSGFYYIFSFSDFIYSKFAFVVHVRFSLLLFLENVH